MVGKLFSHPGFYCLVAENDGRIIGSNCLDERSMIYGLGPLTIDPASQNGGAGRALMTAMIERSHLRNASGVRLLQSAFHNRSLSLYAKLGFDVREPMCVMQGAPIGQSFEGCVVRSAAVGDIERCNQLCEQIHGHNREGELHDAIAQGTALVVERHGRITGYATGFGYFAHAVGEANLDLQALLGSAKDVSGPGIIVPLRNTDLFRWLLGNGMRALQPMTLMTMGLYNEPAGAYLSSILY